MVSIEALVPPGHMLLRLAKVIDYGFIRELVAPFYCERNGTKLPPWVRAG